jgi:cyclopropane fatty-acyl-phospholipid synthase-like methyltransferase
MNWDRQYSKHQTYFGAEPDKFLVDHFHLIDNSKPVLDVGAGQGRNSFFLSQNNFQIVAIDPSKIAVEQLNQFADQTKLSLHSVQADFENFVPESTFSAILLIGMLPIISLNQISTLLKKSIEWLSENGFIFVTAHNISDPSFQKISTNWEQIGKNSFENLKGGVRTFLEENEILEIFSGFEVIYHWEGLGSKHSHGDGPIEQHSEIEAIFRKF